MKLKCRKCKKEIELREFEISARVTELGIERKDIRKVYLCTNCRSGVRFTWSDVCESIKLSEKFIEKYKDKVDWYVISWAQKLSEPFIEKYQDNVDWFLISANQKLSEEFIERHQDRVDWSDISLRQKLSEEFIEKFRDKVTWSCIWMRQKLSTEFISKHIDKLDRSIYLNPMYEKLPVSVKLLIRQKIELV